MAGIYVGEVELDVKDITPVVTNTKTKMVMSVEHLKNIVIPREAKNIRIVFDIEEPYPQSISDPIEKPAFLRKIMD